MTESESEWQIVSVRFGESSAEWSANLLLSASEGSLEWVSKEK